MHAALAAVISAVTLVTVVVRPWSWARPGPRQSIRWRRKARPAGWSARSRQRGEPTSSRFGHGDATARRAARRTLDPPPATLPTMRRARFSCFTAIDDAMPRLRRLCGVFGVMAPVLAAVTMTAGGLLTPGYDPMARTISRLAEPGLPAAFAVDLAISLVGVALIALALALGPGSVGGRALLAVAGAGVLVAAAIRLDPTSASATA